MTEQSALLNQTKQAARIDAILMLVLFVIALGLRLPRVGYALPYTGTPDETVAFRTVREMMKNGLNVNPNAYGSLTYYTALIPQIPALFYSFATGRALSVDEYIAVPPGGINDNLTQPVGGIGALFTRAFIAFLASLACLPVYQAARRLPLCSPLAAFGGALVVASLGAINIYWTAQMHPEGIAILLLALLMLAAFIAVESGALLSYAAMGALAAFLLSTKLQYAFAFLILPVIGVVLDSSGGFYRKMTVGVLAFLGGLFISSPYLFLDLPGYLSGNAWQISNLGTGTTTARDAARGNIGLVGVYLRNLFSGGEELGPVVGLVAIIGTGFLLVRRPRHLVVLITYVVPAMLLLALGIVTKLQYNIQFYPFIGIAVAAGIGALTSGANQVVLYLGHRFSRVDLKTRGQRLTPILVLVTFLLMNAASVRGIIDQTIAYACLVPPQVQVAEYLAAHVSKDETVGIFSWIPWDLTDLDRRGISYQQFHPAQVSVQALEDMGIRFVVGTDRITPGYRDVASQDTSLDGLIRWSDYLKQPGVKLIEFGSDTLQFGSGNPYLFVATAPNVSGQQDRGASINLIPDGEFETIPGPWISHENRLQLSLGPQWRGRPTLRLISTSDQVGKIFQGIEVEKKRSYIFSAWVNVVKRPTSVRFLLWECVPTNPGAYCGPATPALVQVQENRWTYVTNQVFLGDFAANSTFIPLPVVMEGNGEVLLTQVRLTPQ